MTRSTPLMIAVSVTVSGCLSGGLEGPYGTDPVAVARGKELAQQFCSACHGLGPGQASNFPGAPTLNDMRFDYNDISRQRSMAQINAGRIRMPPPELSLQEVAEIGAYV